MRSIGRIILRGRALFLAAIAVLTVAFGLALPQLEAREDESTWMAADNPARIEYDRYKSLFGFDRFIVVAYESDDPFLRSEIEYLSLLTVELGELPYVKDAVSLTSVDETVFTSSGSFSRQFLRVSDAPHTVAQRCELDSRIDGNPFVEDTLISGDRRTVGIVLKLEGSLSADIYEKVTDTLAVHLAREEDQTGRRFYYAGTPVYDAKVNETMSRDMLIFMPVTLAVSGIVLFVLFGSLRCVALPLLSVILGLVWTFGLKSLLGSPVTPVSSALVALITIIGVANSVHFISHYRLELTRSTDREKAMLDTFARAGTPCFLTSLTTAVGFGSLVVSHIPLIRHLGAFAGFGIMSAFALTMVLLPIGLSGKVLRQDRTQTGSRMWPALGRFVVEHSRALIVLCVILTLAISLGAFRIQVEPSMAEYLKRSSQVRQAADFFDARLSGSSGIELMLDAPSGSFENSETLRAINHLQNSIENHDRVAQTYSIVDYVKAVNHGSIPGTNAGVARAIDVLERADGIDLSEYYAQGTTDSLRVSIRTKQLQIDEREAIIGDIEEFASSDLQGIQLTVTGADGLVNSITVDIVQTQVYSVLIAMAVILGLMLLFFGPRGALAAILPNVLPVALLFGFLGIAGVKLNIATITVAAICIGLVVDDTIHFFAHFRRIVIKTGDRKAATQETLEEVGSALFFTSLTLVLGFTVFTLSESAFLMQFGFLASGALVVAFVADITVSPAILSAFDVFTPGKARTGTDAPSPASPTETPDM